MAVPRTTPQLRPMRLRSRQGTTLTDLITAMAVISNILTAAAPRYVRARDAYAARAARDVAAAALEQARTLAAGRGTARIVIDPPAGTLIVEAPAGVRARQPLRLSQGFGISMSVDGHAGGPVVLDYNALGLGIIASRTIRFQRGGAEAGISVSTYGRVRRW